MNTVTNFPIASEPSFFEKNQEALTYSTVGALTAAITYGLAKLIGHALKPAEVKKLEEMHCNEKKAMKIVLKWMKKTSTKLEDIKFEDFQAWSNEHAKDAAISVNQFKKINGICSEIAEDIAAAKQQPEPAKAV